MIRLFVCRKKCRVEPVRTIQQPLLRRWTAICICLGKSAVRRLCRDAARGAVRRISPDLCPVLRRVAAEERPRGSLRAGTGVLPQCPHEHRAERPHHGHLHPLGGLNMIRLFVCRKKCCVLSTPAVRLPSMRQMTTICISLLITSPTLSEGNAQAMAATEKLDLLKKHKEEYVKPKEPTIR